MWPQCILQIVCEYSFKFVHKLVEDAFSRRDWELLEIYRRHLPLRKRLIIGTRFLATQDYEMLEERARSFDSTHDAIKWVVNNGNIHVFRIFASHGHLSNMDIENTIQRLRCSEHELEEFYRNKWITLLGFRYVIKRCPWPAAEAWFASKGWRAGKRRRED